MGFLPIEGSDFPAIVLEASKERGKLPIVALLQGDGKFSHFTCFVQNRDNAEIGDFYRVRVVKVGKTFAFVDYLEPASTTFVSIIGADFLEKEARLREAPQLREKAREIREFDYQLSKALRVLASKL